MGLHYIKEGDLTFQHIAHALALKVGDYLKLIKPIHGEGWAQEAVMLTLIDGASAIGTVMGHQKEQVLRHFSERWDYRLAEAKDPIQGLFKLNGN